MGILTWSLESTTLSGELCNKGLHFLPNFPLCSQFKEGEYGQCDLIYQIWGFFFFYFSFTFFLDIASPALQAKKCNLGIRSQSVQCLLQNLKCTVLKGMCTTGPF